MVTHAYRTATRAAPPSLRLVNLPAHQGPGIGFDHNTNVETGPLVGPEQSQAKHGAVTLVVTHAYRTATRAAPPSLRLVNLAAHQGPGIGFDHNTNVETGPLVGPEDHKRSTER